MKKHARLFYLLRLMELGARDRPVRASTSLLSSLFEISQQSASRILQELHESGYVEKEIDGGVISVRLTEKALEEVMVLKRDIDRALRHPGLFEMEGTVFSGFGEGAYYMSKRPYKRQFYRALDFNPYPGTLNLRLEDPEFMRLNIRLRRLKGITIVGYENLERSYGGAKAFKALINGEVSGAIVYASRSAYGPNTAELVSPVNLRERFGLRDGDTVRFQVHLTEEASEENRP